MSSSTQPQNLAAPLPTARWPRALVVGASSGIGEELVRQLAAEGSTVAAVARRKDRLDALVAQSPNVLAYSHDVTRYDEIPALFQEITARLGGLDLIVYSSGVMPEVGPEEFSFDKDRQMIEVNVLGAIAWLNQAALRFGQTGHGTIVGIGSVAGDRGRAGQPVYNTSKAALATYLEALRNRLAKKGVTVVTIKPGPTATPMTEHLNLRGAMPVEQAARVILAKSGKTGEHYLKLTHRIVFLIIRNIPSFVFRRLKI
jgi:NAD(P)-dependent dehydrogenase (short-subunit alcohol dehydrogenase family)